MADEGRLGRPAHDAAVAALSLELAEAVGKAGQPPPEVPPTNGRSSPRSPQLPGTAPIVAVAATRPIAPGLVDGPAYAVLTGLGMLAAALVGLALAACPVALVDLAVKSRPVAAGISIALGYGAALRLAFHIWNLRRHAIGKTKTTVPYSISYLLAALIGLGTCGVRYNDLIVDQYQASPTASVPSNPPVETLRSSDESSASQLDSIPGTKKPAEQAQARDAITSTSVAAPDKRYPTRTEIIARFRETRGLSYQESAAMADRFILSHPDTTDAPPAVVVGDSGCQSYPSSGRTPEMGDILPAGTTLFEIDTSREGWIGAHAVGGSPSVLLWVRSSCVSPADR